MGWKDYVMYRARKTASRRKRIYGIQPARHIDDLLTQEDPSLSFREAIRLFSYILFKSPQRRLDLLWKYLTDKDTPVRKQQIDSLAQDLRLLLSEDSSIKTRFFERNNYSRDLARVPPLVEKALHRTVPHLVIQPKNEQDTARILAFCSSKAQAVFPRGSGSFAFGGAVPTRNGIVLDLSPMRAILEIDPKSKTARVQPGVRWADLASNLEPYGLVTRTTPTSRFSTVAGWVATGGLGLDSYAYGSVTDSVQCVRVARPDGTIESLDSQNTTIKDLFGTEGQFGVLTEITLLLRPKPAYSGTHLLIFKTPKEAFEFIDQLVQRSLSASHVVFFDREYLKRENILFSEQTGFKDPIVPENDAVLFHFETQQSEQKFVSFLDGKLNNALENKIAARHLWADRYFPLKAQRTGPSLLGSEVIVPQNQVPKYITRVRKLARRFGIKAAVEVIVCRRKDPDSKDKKQSSHNESKFSYLVIVSFPCDYSRSAHYVLSLLFIQLLVRMAVRLSGSPYGIGIWNTPFIKSKYDRAQLNRLKKHKQAIDPNSTLNPDKFFTIKGRFFGLPALLLHPVIFRPILAAAYFCAPVLGLISRLIGPKVNLRWTIPAKKDKQGKNLLRQSVQRCTACGACVSVCPAYHITRDELVAGRSKLRMAEAMMNGGVLEKTDAHAAFQCLHCGLCEEVCQTHLPLRDCYSVLEDWLDDRFGPPTEIVKDFVEKLDQKRDVIKDVFGLDLPEWSPDEHTSRFLAVKITGEEGKA